MAAVLLVEDNDDVREMMALALELAGHEVVPARNGLEALGMLRNRPCPCVILLDLMMPVMNGWEFREMLAHEPRLRHVPVVVVSALNRDMAARVGASDYLPKPIDIERMLEIVGAFCDGGEDHCARESSAASHP
jgi:CheY-like chemotaxis protein